MKLAVRNAEGKQVRQITVDDAVFGITPNLAVLHQAFVAQRANQRRGTASTKSRGEVQGSTRKLRNQKYTGRARQGGARSPVRVGGGAWERRFEVDPFKKYRLARGLDDIAMTLEYEPDVAAFEATRPVFLPTTAR